MGVRLTLEVWVVLLGILDQVKFMIECSFDMFLSFKQGHFHIGSVKLPAGT